MRRLFCFNFVDMHNKTYRMYEQSAWLFPTKRTECMSRVPDCFLQNIQDVWAECLIVSYKTYRMYEQSASLSPTKHTGCMSRVPHCFLQNLQDVWAKCLIISYKTYRMYEQSASLFSTKLTGCMSRVPHCFLQNLQDVWAECLIVSYKTYRMYEQSAWARWLSGRVSDSGARGRGLETYRCRVVSLSKTLYSPKVLVNYPGSGGSVPTWLKNCWLGR